MEGEGGMWMKRVERLVTALLGKRRRATSPTPASTDDGMCPVLDWPAKRGAS